MSTYTATVTDNANDWADIYVEITDDSDQDSAVIGFNFRTRAYNDPTGEFDADSFDANTCAEDIADQLGQLGWRPVDGISFSEDRNTFAVEQF